MARPKRNLSKSDSIRMGEEITSFTNSEAWRYAREKIEESYFSSWQESKDVQERENIHAKMSVIKDFETAFRRLEAECTILKRQG